ncbi:MAG: glycoside hydrolase family 15 protein [Terriglobia bacterium]
MAYPPIENHGIIGNMRTVALVGLDGTIDWFCVPRFDSPSVFGCLLDDKKGGHFRIGPKSGSTKQEQYYLPDTNVLITRFLSPEGAGHIADFMPMPESKNETSSVLIRRVKATRGTVTLRLECCPAFNYGRDSHKVEISADGATFRAPGPLLGLTTDVPLRKDAGGVTAECVLHQGEAKTFVLYSGEGPRTPLTDMETEDLLEKTVQYWRRWIAKCNYKGRWREMVHRSALTLELLVYEPTGAVVAAPTTSLPERIGGERNWDYRCSWIRDSAFTVYALIRVGLTDEADRFMNWLEFLCNEAGRDTKAGKNGLLQTVYGIDGRRTLREETLDHWTGYKGSGPVRIGNAAYRQLQMDIFGELMDAVYLYNKYASPISHGLWRNLRRLVDWVCDNWDRTDNGIWEVRAGRQNFVYSKVMCWVTLDRAFRLAMKRSFPADVSRWLKVRDEIYLQTLSQGWNEKRQAFVQHYKSETLDASCLVMPLVFFMSPNDPQMLKTLDAVCRPVSQGGLLSESQVYRYNTYEASDGLKGGEGTFNMCSFWLVEALTRAGRTDPRRLDQACLLFENMLHQANHLGLYSEEAGSCGEALGNFPQAFAHLAFISAAVNLDRALGEAKP